MAPSPTKKKTPAAAAAAATTKSSETKERTEKRKREGYEKALQYYNEQMAQRAALEKSLKQQTKTQSQEQQQQSSSDVAVKKTAVGRMKSAAAPRSVKKVKKDVPTKKTKISLPPVALPSTPPTLTTTEEDDPSLVRSSKRQRVEAPPTTTMEPQQQHLDPALGEPSQLTSSPSPLTPPRNNARTSTTPLVATTWNTTNQSFSTTPSMYNPPTVAYPPPLPTTTQPWNEVTSILSTPKYTQQQQQEDTQYIETNVIQKPPFGSPMPGSVLQKRRNSLTSVPQPPTSTGPPQQQQQQHPHMGGTNMINEPPVPIHYSRLNQGTVSFPPQNAYQQGLHDLSSSLKVQPFETNQATYEYPNTSGRNAIVEESTIVQQQQEQMWSRTTENKDVDESPTLHNDNEKRNDKYELSLSKWQWVSIVVVLVSLVCNIGFANIWGTVWKGPTENNSSNQTEKLPPCFLDNIIDTTFGSTDPPSDDIDAGVDILASTAASLPPVPSHCQMISKELYEPCPKGGVCRNGALVECHLSSDQDKNDSNLFLTVSPTQDACILTAEANLQMEHVQHLLRDWNVVQKCYPNRKNQTSRVFPMNGTETVLAYNVSDIVTSIGMNDPFSNHFMTLVGFYANETFLFYSNNESVPSGGVLQQQGDEILVALHPNVTIDIPLVCQIKIHVRYGFVFMFGLLWTFVMIVFNGLYHLFQDEPMVMSIIAVFGTCFLVGMHYIQSKRAAKKRLELDIINVRHRVYEELSKDPLVAVPVPILCERIVWNDYPANRTQRSYITNQIWKHVVKDIQCDQRVLKTKKISNLDMKLYDHWQWLDVITSPTSSNNNTRTRTTTGGSSSSSSSSGIKQQQSTDDSNKTVRFF